MVLNVMRRLAVRSAAILLVLGCYWALAAGEACGTPLDLIQGPPDIASFAISVSYDASARTLTAVGGPLQYGGPVQYVRSSSNPDGYPFTEDPRMFALSVFLSADTHPHPLGGTLNIDGTINFSPDGGLVSGPLLIGEIEQFGFQDSGGEMFQFVYRITGGTLASDFGGAGGLVGINLDAKNSQFSGSFAANFANSGLGIENATVDTFIIPVPEPSSATILLLLTAAAVAVVAFRRLWSVRQTICR